MTLAPLHRCHHARPTCRWCGATYCPRCDGRHGCEESRDPQRDRWISTWWCSGCGHVIERDEPVRVVVTGWADDASQRYDRYHERCAP